MGRSARAQAAVEIAKEVDGDIIRLWPRNGPLGGRNGHISAEIWVNVVSLKYGRKRLVFIRQKWSKLSRQRMAEVLPEGRIIDLGKVSQENAIRRGRKLLQELCRP